MNHVWTRTNQVLLAITVVLGGLWFWSVRRAGPARVGQADLALEQGRFDPEEVVALHIESGPLHVRLQRQDHAWKIVEPVLPDALADTVEVSRFLHLLATAASDRRVPPEVARSVPAAECGLDPGRARVRIERSGGELHITIGDPLPGGRLYLQILPGDWRVVTSTNLLAWLPTDLSHWRDRTLFPGCGTVAFIRVRRADGLIQMVRTPSGAWKITQPIVAQADQVVLDRLAEMLGAARISEFLRDDLAEGAPYGLDETAVEVAVDSNPQGTRPVTVRFGRRCDHTADHVYAAWPGRPSLFTVPLAIPLTVSLPVDDYRERRLVAWPVDRVAAWCLERGEKRLCVARTNEEWRLTEPIAVEADAARVEGFLHTWLTTRIESYLPSDERWRAVSTGTLVRLRLWSQPSTAEVARVEPPLREVELTLPALPLDPIPVRIIEGDQTNFVTIRAKDPGLVSPEPLRFRSRRLLSLAADSIQTLLLSRDGVDRKLTRTGTNTFATADGKPVPPSVWMPRLRALSALRALHWVADNPPELVSYGLDPPRATLTIVTGQDPTAAVTLCFGRVTPQGVYVWNRSQNLVALLDLETAELLTRDFAPAPPSGSTESDSSRPP